jgi:hypothetical protein
VTAPRIIDVDREMAHGQGGAAAFAGFFLGERMTAQEARKWAQSVTLTFAELEVDDEPLLTDPIVRRFHADLYHLVPFFLYFLNPWDGSGILAFLCAHARDDQIIFDEHKNFRVELDAELDRVLAARLADAATYAWRVGYPWKQIIDEMPVDDRHRQAAETTVRHRIA